MTCLYPIKSNSFICGLSDGTIHYGHEAALYSTNHTSIISSIQKIPSADTKFAVGFQDGDIRHLKLDIENSTLTVGDAMLDADSSGIGIVEILFGDFDGDLGSLQGELPGWDDDHPLYDVLAGVDLFQQRNGVGSGLTGPVLGSG